jgi:uncharacterized membrane protein
MERFPYQCCSLPAVVWRGLSAEFQCYFLWRWWGLFFLTIILLAASAFGQPTINMPPSGQILAPQTSALIRSLDSTLLRARMVDPEGSTILVRFHMGSNVLGVAASVLSNEYVLPWTPPGNGNYSIYASAIDSRGATGRTAIAWLSVSTNPPLFSVIELETGRSNLFFDPRAINNSGTVVGAFSGIGSMSNSAARWADWKSETIEVFGSSSIAKAVSDDGVVVGDYVEYLPVINVPIYHPFIFTPGEHVRRIPSLTNGQVAAISRTGVVGVGGTNYSSASGFRYDGSNFTFFAGRPTDINDAGTIVGSQFSSSGESFLLGGDLGVQLQTNGYLNAVAINRRNQIAMNDGTDSYIYENGHMSRLGILGYARRASDINDDGIVVGNYDWFDGIATPRAFIYHDNVVVGLNNLIPANSLINLASARSINNSGRIVAIGSRYGDAAGFGTEGSRGFLLIPGPLLRVVRSAATYVELKIYFTGVRDVVEASEDLTGWQPILTNTVGAVEASLVFSNANHRATTFYRVSSSIHP